MAYQITDEMKQKYRQAAKENETEARNLIHSIGQSYTRSPEQIAEVLEFGSKFYHYSIGNVELIYAQNPHATYVQSYKAWQKMDANVEKGQKGLKIWVPVVSTMLELDNGEKVPLSDATPEQKRAFEKGFIKGMKSVHFKIGSVFDVSQTNFPNEKLPEIYNMGYTSKEHSAIYDGLFQFCFNEGVAIKTINIESISQRGFFDATNNMIGLNNKLEDTQRLSTLAHEIGHMLQEHNKRDISSAQKELEADAVGILIQSRFGVELTEQRKQHLASHYREFEGKLKGKNPDISEDDIIKLVDEVLGHSMETFKNYAEKIEKCVNQQLEIQGLAQPKDKTNENEIKAAESPENLNARPVRGHRGR